MLIYIFECTYTLLMHSGKYAFLDFQVACDDDNFSKCLIEIFIYF